MELTIKNNKLEAHFEEHWAFDEQYTPGSISAEEYKNISTWIAAHPEHMIYGYLSSFFNICESHNIHIDLTYNTVKNIGAGLSALFAYQKNEYEHNRNVNVIAKTLAAVLSYIAVNEHDLWFRTTNYINQIKKGNVPANPLWGDMISISVGKKNQYVDFLPSCKAGTSSGTFMVASGMTLLVDDVVYEYKKLTGINLAEVGLSNLFINQ